MLLLLLAELGVVLFVVGSKRLSLVLLPIHHLLGLPLLVRADALLQDMQDALHRVRDAVDRVVHVLFGEGETYLFEDLLVEGVPVVGLLRHGVRCTVVMQLNQVRQKVLHYLGNKHY